MPIVVSTFISPSALFLFLDFLSPFFSLAYTFLVAAVTNYHKLSGLNQHKFIILQFWKPGVPNKSNCIKIKMLAKLILSGDLRTICFIVFSSFQMLLALFCLWSPFIFKASNSGDLHLHYSEMNSLLSPSHKNLLDYIGPSQIMQNYFSITKSADEQLEFHLQT